MRVRTFIRGAELTPFLVKKIKMLFYGNQDYGTTTYPSHCTFSVDPFLISFTAIFADFINTYRIQGARTF